ncbi:MAG: hypothetical protein LBS31_09590 [Candidatus Adiutrix sp.]|nr:hypothetical protein [Candidatus Adiutrix sp.]
MVSEVAEASKEQTQGINQITTAMSQMDKVTQSNAASAEESANAASRLSLQAGNLMNAVEDMTAIVHGRGGTLSAQPARASGERKKSDRKAIPMGHDEDFGF